MDLHRFFKSFICVALAAGDPETLQYFYF